MGEKEKGDGEHTQRRWRGWLVYLLLEALFECMNCLFTLVLLSEPGEEGREEGKGKRKEG